MRFGFSGLRTAARTTSRKLCQTVESCSITYCGNCPARSALRRRKLARRPDDGWAVRFAQPHSLSRRNPIRNLRLEHIQRQRSVPQYLVVKESNVESRPELSLGAG